MSNPAYLSPLGQPPNVRQWQRYGLPCSEKDSGQAGVCVHCRLLMEDLAEAITDNADTRRV
jgi:hypothetical protein